MRAHANTTQNDALVSIVNAERRGKRQVLIRPSSKVVIKFLSVMQKHGTSSQELHGWVYRRGHVSGSAARSYNCWTIGSCFHQCSSLRFRNNDAARSTHSSPALVRCCVIGISLGRYIPLLVQPLRAGQHTDHQATLATSTSLTTTVPARSSWSSTAASTSAVLCRRASASP